MVCWSKSVGGSGVVLLCRWCNIELLCWSESVGGGGGSVIV